MSGSNDHQPRSKERLNAMRRDRAGSEAAGAAGAAAAPPGYGVPFLDDVSPLQRAAGAPAGLPAALKSGVEALSGLSLDGIRVHYRSPKPAQVEAAAYAQGREIHLAPGQERHLPHEAWHVVQQMQRRVPPTGWLNGRPLNADPALEREADRAAVRVQQQMPGHANRSLPVSQEVAQPAPIQRNGFRQGVHHVAHRAASTVHRATDALHSRHHGHSNGSGYPPQPDRHPPRPPQAVPAGMPTYFAQTAAPAPRSGPSYPFVRALQRLPPAGTQASPSATTADGRFLHAAGVGGAVGGEASGFVADAADVFAGERVANVAGGVDSVVQQVLTGIRLFVDGARYVAKGWKEWHETRSLRQTRREIGQNPDAKMEQGLSLIQASINTVSTIGGFSTLSMTVPLLSAAQSAIATIRGAYRLVTAAIDLWHLRSGHFSDRQDSQAVGFLRHTNERKVLHNIDEVATHLISAGADIASLAGVSAPVGFAVKTGVVLKTAVQSFSHWVANTGREQAAGKGGWRARIFTAARAPSVREARRRNFAEYLIKRVHALPPLAYQTEQMYDATERLIKTTGVHQHQLESCRSRDEAVTLMARHLDWHR